MAVLESRLVIKATDETAKAFDSVEKRMERLEKAAAQIEKVFSSLARVTGDAGLFQGIAQREEMDAAISGMERLIRLTEEASRAQQGLARSARGAAVALQGEGRGFEAGPGRGAGGGRRAGAHARGGRHGVPLMPGVGPFLPVVAAVETYEVGKQVVENAAELQQQRLKIRELSRSDPSEAPMADRLAADVNARYPGVTQAKALDTYQEIRANSIAASGRVDPAIARRNLMTAAQAQVAASTLGFDLTPHDMQNLLKSVEGTGRANDPTAFGKTVDAYIRAKQMYGSAVNSESLLTYVQNAKSANFGISDDVFYGSLWARLAEGNPARLGNEFSQTMSTLVGGHMTKQGAEWLASHGLISKDQIVDGKGGKFYIKGPLKDAGLLSADPTTWADAVMLPAIKNSGVLDETKVAARMKEMRDEEKKRTGVASNENEDALRERAQAGLISDDLYKSGFRGTVVDQIAHAIVNSALINRDTAGMGKLPGAADVAGDIGKSPAAAFNELSAALSNFGAVLSSPAVADAGPVMDSLAHGIQSATSALQYFMGGGKVLNNYPAQISDDWATTGEWRTRVAYGRQADDHPIILGERDMEGARGRALSGLIEGGHATQEVSVTGEATVHVPIAVTVTASPDLFRVVEDARNAARDVMAKMPLVPTLGGHDGRMDSDAAPMKSNGTWDR